MPELPEVETYARDLAEVLTGRVFWGVSVDWPNLLPANEPAEMDERIRGQRVEHVHRRGKYLVFRLASDWLLVHLKMTGRLQLMPIGAPPHPHVHVVLALDEGAELRFRDPRKFGRVYLVSDPDTVLGKLGPEPLGPQFSEECFHGLLRRRRGRLKSLLLDQSFVAGLGNIYADESLWASGLHPLRRANALSRDEERRLYEAIRKVLSRAIEARGSSLTPNGYRDLTGNQGEMQESLAAYGRAGQPCLRCGHPLERIVVGARGTHFCPLCQRR